MKEIERRLVEMRQEGRTSEHMAREVKKSVSYVRKKMSEFIKAGLIDQYPPDKRGKRNTSGRTKVKKDPKQTAKPRKKPETLGVRCEYPSCTIPAVFTFSLVPLCPSHFEVIADETELYYSAFEDDEKRTPPPRKHWLMIAERSKELWRNQRANISTQTKSAVSLLNGKQKKRSNHSTAKRK